MSPWILENSAPAAAAVTFSLLARILEKVQKWHQNQCMREDNCLQKCPQMGFQNMLENQTQKASKMAPSRTPRRGPQMYQIPPKIQPWLPHVPQSDPKVPPKWPSSSQNSEKQIRRLQKRRPTCAKSMEKHNHGSKVGPQVQDRRSPSHQVLR